MTLGTSPSDNGVQFAPKPSKTTLPPYLQNIDPATGRPKSGNGVNLSPAQAQQVLSVADPNYSLNQYLRASSAAANNAYVSQANLNALAGAQDAAYYGANAGYINSSYGNNLGLLDQDRYRNVDLARGDNAENRRYVTQTWDDLRKALNNQRNTSIVTNRIQNWLYGQNVGFNQRDRDLNFNRALLTRNDAWRGFTTDAIARGARSSRGYGQNVQSAADQYAQARNEATLGYDTRDAQLTAAHQTDFQQLRAQLEAQLANYNNGANAYAHGIQGVDSAGAAINSLANTYAIRANQLAVDRDRSLNDNTHSQQNATNQRTSDLNSLSAQYLQSVLGNAQAGLGR